MDRLPALSVRGRSSALKVKGPFIPCRYLTATCPRRAVGTLHNTLIGPIPVCDNCAALAHRSHDVAYYPPSRAPRSENPSRAADVDPRVGGRGPHPVPRSLTHLAPELPEDEP